MNIKLDKILAEISAGELVDKITILEIKKSKITSKDKLREIEKELISLNQTMIKSIPDNSKILNFINELKNINLKLWAIEDGKRAAEKNNDFVPFPNFAALKLPFAVLYTCCKSNNKYF